MNHEIRWNQADRGLDCGQADRGKLVNSRDEGCPGPALSRKYFAKLQYQHFQRCDEGVISRGFHCEPGQERPKLMLDFRWDENRFK